MSRRRSTPWIHRWSRPIMGAIAILGALLTAYLTVTKLAGATPACLASAGAEGASSCKDVLNSPYANIFGLPLSLFGFLAYTSMAVFALAPLAIKTEDKRSLSSPIQNWTWLLLFAGATAMTIFSGYLMYLLAFEIKAVCLWCIASATFSISLLVLALIGRSWEDIGQLFFTGILVGMLTLITTFAVYANVNQPVVTDGPTIPPITTQPSPGVGWANTTNSGAAEIALAEHLTKVGAKMYGAWWCPHCHEQKLLFGQEAFSKINYIECDPSAQKNPQPQLCDQAGIKSYPTWQINGKLEPGVLTGEKLAQLTGYKGPSNFKYSLPGR